jgi:hypothetical protein
MKIVDIADVNQKSGRFFSRETFKWWLYQSGGTLCPMRPSMGKQPRSHPGPPMMSRTAGMTMLSVLKIQPIRSTI